MTSFAAEPADILARLAALRAADAPTHGGHVMSYVYDSGLADLDEPAAAAIPMMQPGKGLDRTTFTSVGARESDDVGGARAVPKGDEGAVGAGENIGAGATISKHVRERELTVARAKQQTIAGWKRPLKKA